MAQTQLQKSQIEERVIEEDKGKKAIEEHARLVTKKEVSDIFSKSQLESLEKKKKEDKVEQVKLKKWKTEQEVPQLEPRETSEYEREVDTSTSRQTQKEVLNIIHIYISIECRLNSNLNLV